MKTTKIFKKYNIIIAIGAIVGGVGGYFYWLKVGCASGSCPITSSPVMSTLWGMLMGGLLFSMFVKKDETPKENQNNINQNETD